MKKFRRIISQPASAAYNMALDEKIFHRYLADGVPTFRVYQWASPSFTYGVLQKPERELDLARCSADGVEVVKRMTGGGILFHNDELTYSFVCSKDDVGESKSVLISYREICAFLLRFYESLGLTASYAMDSGNFSDRSKPHPICSASHEKYDIVINGKKIGGNAQKRSRQIIFQHGAIPCSIDWNIVRRYVKSMPEDIENQVTMLSEELKIVPDKEMLSDKLIDVFSSEFDISFIEDSLQCAR